MALLMAFFTTLPVGIIQTNCYIFGDGDDVVVIDPGSPDTNIIKKIRQISKTPKLSILLTHAHADHFMGVDFLLQAFPGSPLFCSNEDQPYLFDSNLNCAKLFNLDITLKDKSTIQTVTDGQILTFGKYQIEVMSTPGHTPGGVIYVLREQKTTFTGDTLFRRSVGRSDFPGGNLTTLRKSLREKVLKLPGDFSVYPGHGQPTTIAEEQNVI